MSVIGRFETGGPDLEAGTYPVTCVDLKEDVLENSQYDPNVFRWTLVLDEVVDPDGKGIELTAISGRKLTPNAKLTKWLAALGVPFADGRAVDTDEVIGKHCLCLIGIRKTDQGGEFVRVEDLMPLPRASQKTAARARTPEQDGALAAENARMAGNAELPASHADAAESPRATAEQVAYVGRLLGDAGIEGKDMRERVGITAPVGTPLTVAEVSRAIAWLKAAIEAQRQDRESVPF